MIANGIISISVSSPNRSKTLSLKSCAVRGPTGTGGAASAEIDENGLITFTDNNGIVLFTVQIPASGAAGASIDNNGLITFTDSFSEELFTLQLPLYNGAIENEE